MIKMKIKRIIYLFLFLCVFVGGRNDVWGEKNRKEARLISSFLMGNEWLLERG